MTPQPIETAPKDGTWILVCTKDSHAWVPILGSTVKLTNATHWLPMPPMPEVNEHD